MIITEENKLKEIVKELEKRNDTIKEAEYYKEFLPQIAQEELAELIQSISKIQRSMKYVSQMQDMYEEANCEEEKRIIVGKIKSANYLRNGKLQGNLCEEIADVLISLKWILDLYKVNVKDVGRWINYKADRMKKRFREGDFY